MKLFVVGANGRTGRHVVEQALAAGHAVTAFVRRPDGLPAAGLDVVVGDVVGDPRGVADALGGSDAVVSTLGTGLFGRSRRPTIAEAAHTSLATAMRAAGVRRVVTMLSYGSGATRARAPLGVRLLAATALRTDFADLTRAGDALVRADLDFTIVHFGRLTDDAATGRSRLSASLGAPPHWAVPRADLAGLLLGVVVDRAHVRGRVVAAGPGRGR